MNSGGLRGGMRGGMRGGLRGRMRGVRGRLRTMLLPNTQSDYTKIFKNKNQGKMTQKERQDRVIARGETSGHSHIVVGTATIERKDGKVFIHVPNTEDACAVMRHLLEKPFVERGEEVWTGEHADIELQPGRTYQYVQQIQYDPFEKIIRAIQD